MKKSLLFLILVSPLVLGLSSRYKSEENSREQKILDPLNVFRVLKVTIPGEAGGLVTFTQTLDPPRKSKKLAAFRHRRNRLAMNSLIADYPKVKAIRAQLAGAWGGPEGNRATDREIQAIVKEISELYRVMGRLYTEVRVQLNKRGEVTQLSLNLRVQRSPKAAGQKDLRREDYWIHRSSTQNRTSKAKVFETERVFNQREIKQTPISAAVIVAVLKKMRSMGEGMKSLYNKYYNKNAS